MEKEIKYIGHVLSSLKRLEDCPLQESEDAPGASIVIAPEFVDGIKNIEPGTQILVLTWLHRADRSVVQCVPRNNFDAPKIGVFSTRSPDRPNPIGIHFPKIISIRNNEIKVSNLEVLDQTPVIDIKPIWNIKIG
jgi:tRNA-Thr(GGU) m(6)t(6)A37 methyltransferase TsaA